MARQLNDLTGKVFGRLTVVSYYGIINNNSHWNCMCSCGKTRIVSNSGLTKKQGTLSCGCLRGITPEMHGCTNMVEYKIWEAMRRRCRCKSDTSYSDYGGRGITVCESWNNSFQAFLKDIGQRPTNKHTIDRIDNNGNYTPENCRWTTRKEQVKNRRCAHNLTYNGVTKTLLEWANQYGLKYETLLHRIKTKWPSYDALTKPMQFHYPRSTV